MTDRDRAASDALIGAMEGLSREGDGPRLLQIGACDGRNFDPAYAWLRRSTGASGVFVEPLAEYIPELFSSKSMLADICILNLAVSDRDGLAEIRFVSPEAIGSGEAPKWALGISTLSRGKNAIDGKRISAENYEKIRLNTVSRMIPVISTRTLMKFQKCLESNVYMSDCEGHDAAIFLDLDLETYRPEVFFMEGMLMEVDEKSSVFAKLRFYGYSIVDDGVDIFASLRRYGLDFVR